MRKKQTANQLADEQKWLASLEKMAPKFARQQHAPKSSKLEYTLTTPPGRETLKIGSKVTPGASTAQRHVHQYSGNAMLGYGTLHKSNTVPVFSTDDAKDIARMRR